MRHDVLGAQEGKQAIDEACAQGPMGREPSTGTGRPEPVAFGVIRLRLPRVAGGQN